MTELSPTGIVGGLRSLHDASPEPERRAALAAQGTAVPLVDLRIVDVETGEPLPNDGEAVGELQAHGPTVAGGYLGHESAEVLTADGWLPTGDVASIDARGYIVIHDRLKDLIKSGGEWISSLELENAILADPAVAEVAVVGRPDPRWTERPVAFVVARADSSCDPESVLAHLRPRVPKWWLPDEVHLLDALPRTGTGKVAKQELRAML
jgi:fatty-acyl-CoA synthase